MEALLANYVTSPALAAVVPALGRSRAGNAEDFLRAVVAKHPDPQVQGRAAYALAKLLLSRADTVKRLKEGDGKFRETVERDYGQAMAAQLDCGALTGIPTPDCSTPHPPIQRR